MRDIIRTLLNLRYQFLYIVIIAFTLSNTLVAQDDFRYCPYLQNPAPNAITIIWFSEKERWS